MTFKEKVLKELLMKMDNTKEPMAGIVVECIKVVQGIPEEQNSGEKTAGPNYKARCAELEKQLKEAECMAEGYRSECDDVHRRLEYLMGYKDAVEVLCGRTCQRKISTDAYAALKRPL